ncbi:DUF1963 domain-containing protein [Microlunatus elymi]|uniref:DUF1963 domain-containing protein n=1 Tax=Microlunatus elymi TaxID=2596828 RepID=A0A516PYR4_9ACTN|nr:DUF1963 domain-containing protein [Microlunatus elymi]QDP96315.1 DUF1963 domain-containing protein [Microlunatus elymi]
MNAFWNRWRKQLAWESVPAGTVEGRADRDPAVGPALTDELERVLTPVMRPCAGIALAGAAESPIHSFLTGHPYLPAGTTWPEGAAGPQIFVGQINFAEVASVGALPGFPRTGLLQWFVDADDTYGLTFDRSAGTAGFSTRWYADPSTAAGSPQPDAPTPTDTVDDLPMEFVGPTALQFRHSISIPDWSGLPAQHRSDPIWERLAAALGERRADPEFVYEEYVRGGSSLLDQLRTASKVGGYPSFTQDDPRGTGSYPAADSGQAELIIELDSIDVGGWGDSGVAHLFGDPAALATGGLTSIRYHWDCL